MALDTRTQIKLATAARKGKRSITNLFTGCKGENTDKNVTIAPAMLVNLIGIGGLGIAITAIVLSAGGLLLDICGFFLCFFAPYSIYQKHILKDLGTFRSLLNNLRMQVNEFMLENDLLKENLRRLGQNIDGLERVEENFSRLVKSNEVDRFVAIVTETRQINDKMKKITKSAIVQQLITTVLRSDNDGDLHIGPGELEELMIRLEAPGTYTFHRDRFLKILGTEKDIPVERIVKVIRNLKDETLPPSQRIFTFDATTAEDNSSKARKTRRNK